LYCKNCTILSVKIHEFIYVAEYDNDKEVYTIKNYIYNTYIHLFSRGVIKSVALSTVNVDTVSENQFRLSISILLIKQDRGMLVVINRTSSCSLHEFFAGANPAGFRFKGNRQRIGAGVDAGEA